MTERERESDESSSLTNNTLELRCTLGAVVLSYLRELLLLADSGASSVVSVKQC